MNETATGLPELPEGQFWRVAKTKHRMFDSGSPYTLHLMERIQCPDVIEEKNPKFRWWNLQPPRTFRKATEADRSRSVVSAWITRWISDDDLSDEEKEHMRVREVHWKSNVNLYTDHPRQDRSLTPRAIRETADNLLADHAKDTATRSLLGDYPPKKLN